MPIGYANFGTIEQANNQTVNQLAGLGQQIGNAIETHAATQSAQAMLPMLQQQYQNGMSRIAKGDPNGLGDVYSASVVASQNPLLAPMANHAVSMAQSANINAQHMARTQAYIGGRMAGLYGQYGSGLMNPPDGMNPNWQGKQSQTKAATLPQQISALKNFQDVDAKLADQQASALRTGDQSTYNQIVQQRQAMRDTLSQGGMNVPQLSGNESQPFDNASQLKSLNSQLKAEQARHTIFGLGGPDQKKIDSLTSKIKELQSSQLPSVKGSGSMGSGKWSNPNVPDSAVKYLLQNPSVADQFDAKYGKGMAGQILKSQSSNDTGMGANIAQTSPESQDESEAVGGGSEEETPPDEQTMVA